MAQNYDDGQDEYEEKPARRPLWIRLVAFMTALAVLGLAVVTAFPGDRLSLGDLVKNSFQLKKNVDPQLTAAVVKIDVITRRQGTVSVEKKLGTGFNIDPGGVIITNHHVIEDALNMSITFPDGKVCRADRWSSRPEADLAVIALQSENLPVAPVDFSRLPAPGDKIRVVGNPLELNNILVEGKVEQYLKIRDRQGKIFSIDAPIYPGNSGSPVYNMSGQVVGVIFGSLQGEKDGSGRAKGLAVAVVEARGLIDAVLAEKQAGAN
ncbi:S1C family serine protease [Pelotomaculum propionicicum]|uniref:S1C family serine protease n=1 Tax=Pelotomaculum propionicicum TaxID=258475 RepID=UPI003B76A4BE